MRGLALGLLIAALALGAPAGAKTVYPYDRKACFPNGFEKEYEKQGLSQLVSNKQRAQGNGGSTSAAFAFLGVWRNILLFEHAAEQCRLRSRSKPYNQRCPHVNFSAQWIISNAPPAIWNKSRAQINAARTELRLELETAKVRFREACRP